MKRSGFVSRIPLKDAVEIIASCVKQLATEAVKLEEVLGRVLGEDVISPVDVPPFDRAAVDGYALMASDTFGASQGRPKKLKVVGSVVAGAPGGVKINKGEAVAVMTGAPIPEGADAVVMVENTSGDGKVIKVLNPVTPGKNVSTTGEDVKKGDAVLRRGRIMRPCDIGLLAAIGRYRIHVYRRPEVGIISTGGELISPQQKLIDGKIFDSNSYSLSAAVASCGGIPHRLGIARGDRFSIARKIREALAYDAVVVSGGSSVGEQDTVPDAVSEMGELKFHGVGIRPGGPSAFGLVDDKPVFCLAGFPAGSLVAFDMLVRPCLRVMQGLPPDRGYRKITARLGEKVASALGRSDVVRVKLTIARGEIEAVPIRITGSSMITTITRADGFIMIPDSSEGLNKGEQVEVELY